MAAEDALFDGLVLSSFVRRAIARTSEARLAARWNDFVMDGFGCRCVEDEPWVTVAETAELIHGIKGAWPGRRRHARLAGAISR